MQNEVLSRVSRETCQGHESPQGSYVFLGFKLIWYWCTYQEVMPYSSTAQWYGWQTLASMMIKPARQPVTQTWSACTLVMIPSKADNAWKQSRTQIWVLMVLQFVRRVPWSELREKVGLCLSLASRIWCSLKINWGMLVYWALSYTINEIENLHGATYLISNSIL